MKTPKEIKKGLECRIRSFSDSCNNRCGGCRFFVDDYSILRIYKDALALIQQLEAENTELKKEKDRLELDITIREIQKNALIRSGEQLEKERDALLEYLRKSHIVSCDICKYEPENGGGVMACKRVREINGPCWEWRGLCEENGGKPEPPKEEER